MYQIETSKVLGEPRHASTTRLQFEEPRKRLFSAYNLNL
jgi:hypothetical protein